MLEQQKEQISERFVICDICDEYLEYKIYYAQEHLEKHPTHRSYSIK
jgi:hypothetical protein